MNVTRIAVSVPEKKEDAARTKIMTSALHRMLLLPARFVSKRDAPAVIHHRDWREITRTSRNDNRTPAKNNCRMPQSSLQKDSKLAPRPLIFLTPTGTPF